MRVSLIKEDRIRSIDIPDVPSGNFWITDYDDSGKEENLLNIKEENGSWKLTSNQEVYYNLNDTYNSFVFLKEYSFYPILKVVTNEKMTIYTSSSYDKNYSDYYINLSNAISIGSGINNNIRYDALEIDHAKIIYENNKFYICKTGNNAKIYVNSLRVFDKKALEYGDIIFLNGLKIVFMKYGNGFKISIYYFNNSLAVSGLNQITYDNFEEQYDELEEDIDMRWYKDNDYFHKTPRFVSEIKEKEIKIDVPPTKEAENDMPVILTIGPMLTMSMSSMVMAFSSIANISSGRASLMSSLPSIVMAVAMVLSTLLWPTFTRKYEDKKRKKKEKERISKYSTYIEGKRKVIQEELVNQTNILKNNYPNLYTCSNIILKRDPLLWQKRIEDEDFLKVSLGFGSYEMKLKIVYPEEQFTMQEDKLKDISDKLSREPKILKDVPVPYSFLYNNITSIIGNYNDRSDYLKKLIFQIVTFHSYADLKIVIFTDDDKKNTWKNIKNLPYCFNDDKQIRLFASKSEEYQMVSSYLEKILNDRKNLTDREVTPNSFDKIYLIITDSFKMIRNQDFIQNLLKTKENYGFSFIISNGNIATLPDQCKNFIKVNSTSGEVAKNVINEKNQTFMIDSISGINYNECYKILSNTPVEISNNADAKLPEKLGFLEMYDVGKIEQLNSVNRWKKSNPMESLKTPVGYGKNNELQYIDLHEKYHGPHGLIAGMTGSGKSEFIISYILSLAVNYSPLEVQFILIDYKGGGLAGAFENASSGKKLPHLVGTITNLDASEIKRSISSIESELKRRQRLFNTARDKNGESTVDIYKYQRLFREGKVDEAVSHLFIISDEFAELKNQEPEFMDQLISTARIGRSLGVHLILATQKPSGVVDPQIWSNTRFRVCLRVQDTEDSNEVIKCPDAAYLTKTGRYYFQVGYNEVFTLGQASWTGGNYIPKEKTKKPIDTSINFINNVGQTIKKVETKEKKDNTKEKKYGQELTNVVNYLSDIANNQKLKIMPLWLDKIPNFIKIDSLISKYNYSVTPGIIDLPVGEYDMPEEQKQNILTVPLSKYGNTLVYGSPGSGKENFIMTLIYSAINLYTPSDINFYILDFGSEVLSIFSNSPFVGDIVNMDDEEKIINLYKLINKIIEERKELLQPYGGNFYNYNAKNLNKLPVITVILNNFESYQDLYEKYEDTLGMILRECSRYGIYFIITCNSPNGLRIKLKQNFSQIFCLQQNNEDDYSTILGSVNKTYPAHLYGRGIIKREKVYEFQTASIDNQDNLNGVVEDIIKRDKQKYKVKAKKIPSLPSKVSYNEISDVYDNTNKNVIIGIEKKSLNISSYDFTKNTINAISANDSIIMQDFVNSLIMQLKNNLNFQTMVLDASDMTINEACKKNILYENNNFNDIFEKLLKYQNDCYVIYENNNYNASVLQNQKRILLVINGIESFKNKLKIENQNRLEEFFNKTKGLDIINFIIIDSIDKIKKIEYDSWFKDNFDSSNGIWIGDQFDDQFTFKISVRTEELKEQVSDDFCFVLNRGKPVLVKYVSDFNIQNDDEMVESIE